jgi:hypothetical protein
VNPFEYQNSSEYAKRLSEVLSKHDSTLPLLERHLTEAFNTLKPTKIFIAVNYGSVYQLVPISYKGSYTYGGSILAKVVLSTTVFLSDVVRESCFVNSVYDYFHRYSEYESVNYLDVLEGRVSTVLMFEDEVEKLKSQLNNSHKILEASHRLMKGFYITNIMNN